MHTLLQDTKTIKTDVLIIGGGSSGVWAANEIKKANETLSVTIVDKGPEKWGGLLAMSGGDLDAVVPGESVEDWMKDIVYYWDGLCDQELVERMFTESYNRLQDYESMGCEFLYDQSGNLKGVPQRGLKHVKLYLAKDKGCGGEHMAHSIRKRAENSGVQQLGRILITDFLKQDNKIVGAVGFHTVDGTFYVFQTKAIILACGQTGWKTSYMNNTSSGDWLNMSLRAGAKVRNFEFGRVWNVPKYFAWEGQTTLLPLGAKFVNRNGEDFMKKYSPVIGPNTDPHFTTIGMAMECREGRGPIYFDVSELKMDGNEAILKPNQGWQLLNYNKLCALGMDFFKDSSEWYPQLTNTFGGLVTDIDGATNIEGLYAAGTCRSFEPGVYIGGLAISITATMGIFAGRAVSQYLNGNNAFEELNPEEIACCKKRLMSYINETVSITPKNVLDQIRTVMFPYDVSIIKNEDSLQHALKEIHRIEEELLPQLKANDAHTLLKLMEVTNILTTSELYLTASLLRKETRAGHYREDYPKRDEKNGLSWIILSKIDDTIKTEFEPLPLEKYKYPITAYYSDCFNFSK
ncbi:MAG: FAD-binding protein [Peptococcaceae bacterium]